MMGPARLVLLMAVFYAALLADTQCAPRLAIARVAPDWTALVLLVWLLRSRTPWSPLIAGGLGLLADLAAGGRIGPGVAAFALAGYLVPQLALNLPSRSVLVEAVAVALGTLGIGLILVTIAFVAAELDHGLSTALLHIVGTATYTGIAAIPILMAQHWIVGQGVRPRWMPG
jgi:rod shape-determining protein MreD